MKYTTSWTATNSIPYHYSYVCSKCGCFNTCEQEITVSSRAFTKTSAREGANDALRNRIAAMEKCDYKNAEYHCRCKRCGHIEPWARMRFAWFPKLWVKCLFLPILALIIIAESGSSRAQMASLITVGSYSLLFGIWFLWKNIQWAIIKRSIERLPVASLPFPVIDTNEVPSNKNAYLQKAMNIGKSVVDTVEEHKQNKDIIPKEKTHPESSSPEGNNINWLCLASELLDNGRKEGYILSRDNPKIPELMVCAEQVCTKIMQAEIAYEKKHGTKSSLTLVVYSWSAFAGMGAVYLWNKDWDSLSKKGIYETLTEEDGFYGMDESVFNTIGIPFGSPKCEELCGFITKQVPFCVSHITSKTQNPDISSFIAGAKAMYVLGMVFEMNQLGIDAFSSSNDDATVKQTIIQEEPDVLRELSNKQVAEIAIDSHNSTGATIAAIEHAEAIEPDIQNDYDNKTIKYCRYCGFELLKNSAFCSHCGKKVV